MECTNATILDKFAKKLVVLSSINVDSKIQIHKRLIYLCIIIFIAFFVNIVAYVSIFPISIYLLIYLPTFFLILLFSKLSTRYLYTYNLIFFVGVLFSGISAIYVNYLGDDSQLYSDASSFYEISSNINDSSSIQEVQLIHGGALSIIIWRKFYYIFNFLGFPTDRCIGIAININNVALASIIILKSSIQIYGNNSSKIRTLNLLLATCGIFWLFSSIHLRDSFGFFLICILIYEWVIFLNNKINFYKIIKLSFVNIILAILLFFIRQDFLMVPLIIAISSFISFNFNIDYKIKKSTRFFLFMSFLFLSFFAISYFNESIIHILVDKTEGYSDLASIQQDSNSLGMLYIVNQPILIRLIFGSIYLFLFPIPFWSGFQLESAYSLFKSFNAIYFYFLTPLFLYSITLLLQIENRRRVIVFLFITSLSFIFTIALTSLETRHFGAFLSPIILLCLLPDLTTKLHRKRNLLFLISYLFIIFVIHSAWYIIKYS